MALASLLSLTLSPEVSQNYGIEPPALYIQQMDALRRILASADSTKIADILSLLNKAPVISQLDPLSETVSLKADISSELRIEIERRVSALIPWLKGPYNLFGIEIDSQWRSQLKFQRLQLTKDQILDRAVCDVGCANGYYLFRLLGFKPRMLIGLDPTPRNLLQFLLIRSLIREPINISFLPLRDEILSLTPNKFDLTLCLGVFYHHPHPEILLNNIFNSLTSGGRLLLETLYLDQSLFLNGKGRYAQMRNIHIIPSLELTQQFLTGAGFREIHLVDTHILSDDEQRTTALAPGPGLSDFIDPYDRTKTIQGYPRPHRALFEAIK